MQLTPVQSSNIAAVGYDAPTQKLQIQFYRGGQPGPVYEYDNVQPRVYEGLIGAPSIGGWFKDNIKNNKAFPYRKLTD